MGWGTAGAAWRVGVGTVVVGSTDVGSAVVAVIVAREGDTKPGVLSGTTVKQHSHLISTNKYRTHQQLSPNEFANPCKFTACSSIALGLAINLHSPTYILNKFKFGHKSMEESLVLRGMFL